MVDVLGIEILERGEEKFAVTRGIGNLDVKTTILMEQHAQIPHSGKTDQRGARAHEIK